MIDETSTKQKRHARDMRKELRTIYEGTDGSMPDMSTFAKRPHLGLRRFLIRAIVVLLILSAAAWAGFFFFTNGFLEKQNHLSVQIEGPEQVKSGDDVTYVIRYENKGSVPVASMELSLSLPPDFHLDSTTPEPNDKNTWTIGSLTPKSDGAITVNGRFVTEVSSKAKLQTLITYKPANFNSSFEQVETKEVQINDTVLQMSLSGPEQGFPGDELTYTFTVGNTKTSTPDPVRLTPVLPPNFTVTRTEPAFENGQSYWNTATIDQNKPKTFTLKGSFTTTATGEQTMAAHVGFVSDNVYLKQSETKTITRLQGGSLAFHLVVNGSSGNLTIDPRKTLNGSIDYTNPSESEAKDVSFTVTLSSTDPLPIDWSKANLASGKRSGNQITWDKSSISALGALKPSARGVIDFSLPLQSSSQNADHFTLTAQANAGNTTISATPVLVTLSSETSLQAQARYFTEDGAPLGNGPLPPAVGKTTTYKISWDLSNSLRDLSNATITTILPPHVTWTGKTTTDIGTISYKSSTGIVTWSIPKLPTSVPDATATFMVSIKPAASDVGKTLSLTETINFTATAGTQSLTKSVGGLSTILTSDSFATGKSAVVAQ